MAYKLKRCTGPATSKSWRAGYSSFRNERARAAIVDPQLSAIAGSELSERFRREFSLGRDPSGRFICTSGQPDHGCALQRRASSLSDSAATTHASGHYWYPARLLLELVLPLVLLICGCLLLYRHLNAAATTASRQLGSSAGRLLGSGRGIAGARRDELAGVASTFDSMAERIGGLIIDQRRRLAEMSHELRTPLARIEMAVSLAEQGGDATFAVSYSRDCSAMRRTVEDALTLSWLETERPTLRAETLDLTDLLDSILDDAHFEYPDRQIETQLPAEAELVGSCHRALGQAVENIVRNALGHTPPGKTVWVCLHAAPQAYRLEIIDEGPGVPPHWLERIFQPFERVSGDRPGFGLGLALASGRFEQSAGVWLRATTSTAGYA